MFSEPFITLFGQGVYLYGICMAVGIICCFIFLYYALVKINANDEAITKMLFFGIVATGFGVFMSAVFQGIYDAIAGKGFSLKGLTFYGGLIGGVSGFLIIYLIYIYVVAPRAKRRSLQNHMNMGLTDGLPFVPIGIGIAHAFGRLGCTFAGCCYGVTTDAWYGIYIRDIGESVVPTATIEGLFLVILTIVMLILYFRLHFKYNMTVYCIAYGVFRFLIDYVRGDDRGTFIPGFATPSQFWAIVMVVLGIAYFFFAKYFLNKFMMHPERGPSQKEIREAEERMRDEAATAKKAPAASGASSQGGATDVNVAVKEEKKQYLSGGTWACVGVMIAAIIFVIVGIFTTFASNRYGSYKLDSYLLNSGLSNSTAAYALGMAAMALALLLAVGYAAFIILGKRYNVDRKWIRYTLLILSMVVMATAIIMLIFSNNIFEGEHINFLDSGTGAKLLFFGCFLGCVAGMCASLKEKI
ncbi:MAG: prolipoprotein diacylglyceryl transferase [Clostridia bacterium]|nr:prolipoprotein diacylglyceryl transferase [Clostridia bacterium]